MAERLKDEADRKLESLLRSEPVLDDGFTDNILKRVRREMWVRRLTMPFAIMIGALFAAKPAVQLFGAIPAMLNAIPASIRNVANTAIINLPDMSTVVMGIMLLAAAMLASRILEE
jgi:hypothetical protein